MGARARAVHGIPHFLHVIRTPRGKLYDLDQHVLVLLGSLWNQPTSSGEQIFRARDSKNLRLAEVLCRGHDKEYGHTHYLVSFVKDARGEIEMETPQWVRDKGVFPFDAFNRRVFAHFLGHV